MILIKKDTILKNGDLLIHSKNDEKWILKSFEGHLFTLTNQLSGKSIFVKKNDLLLEPWHLVVGNGRGYW